MRKRILGAALTLALLALCAAGARAEDGLPLPIIMYHHINPDRAACGDYTITPETLEGDLRLLRERGYTAASGADLLAFCKGEAQLPKKPVIICFDDGQESFLAYALPLLEKYDMSAIFAPVASYCDLFTETEDHNLAYSYCSWGQLAELSQNPRVELAGHSFAMHELGARRGCLRKRGESEGDYLAALRLDLDKMGARFTEYTGAEPEIFAYPFGFYSPLLRGELISRGYKILLTCDERVNYLHGEAEELLALGRFNRPQSAGREAFFARLGIK